MVYFSVPHGAERHPCPRGANAGYNRKEVRVAFYEVIYILRPDLTNEQVEVVVKRVTDLITGQEGKILQTEYWGRRDLAYEVKKNTKGFYVYHSVEGGGNLVRNIEDRFKIDEDILKYQNIRVEKPVVGPTAMSAPERPEVRDPEEEEGLAALEEEDEDEV